jgi:hypothetical protein
MTNIILISEALFRLSDLSRSFAGQRPEPAALAARKIRRTAYT